MRIFRRKPKTTWYDIPTGRLVIKLNNETLMDVGITQLALWARYSAGLVDTIDCSSTERAILTIEVVA